MTCRDICKNYKMVKRGNTARYSNGQKRCNHCKIFLKWEGIRCPCCGYVLRTRPRSKKLKDKYKEAMLTCHK